MANNTAKRASSSKQKSASRRNIAKAHLARFRSREPRSAGRVRPSRRVRQNSVYAGRSR